MPDPTDATAALPAGRPTPERDGLPGRAPTMPAREILAGLDSIEPSPPQARTEAEILADWRALPGEYTKASFPGVAAWKEHAADRADRQADLLEEASRLDPMPREVVMNAVGYAVWHLRDHARRMREGS